MPECKDKLDAGQMELVNKLGKRMKSTIRTDRDDAGAGKDANEFVSSGIAIGLTREEIRSLLGKGTTCGSCTYQVDGKVHHMFQDFDFAIDDLFYPVGRLPKGSVGGVPTIVLGFDKDGKCTKAKVIHTQ